MESGLFRGDISIGSVKFRKTVSVSLINEITFHVKLSEDGMNSDS